MFRKHLRIAAPALGWLALFIGAAYLPSDVDQATPAYAGAIDSQFSLGSNGEAELVFPIEVIPGTNQLEPDLALHYNSKGGNGLAGMGMRLDGLSVIERTGATPVQDGFWGSVNYNANDRFTLDGQRLMVVEGVYGAAGSVYHTQIESWKKVEAVGQCGSGPCGFKVWQKDGTLYEYGQTADSRIEAVGKADVRVWALNRITDLNGNYLDITYREKSGTYYPLMIAYTGNQATGLTPGRFVDFSYEVRSDSIPQFEGGAPYRVTDRLTGITTRLGNRPVFNYKINYTYETITGRSMVTTVDQCDSANACLPPTLLGWSEGDSSLLTAARPLSLTVRNSGIYSIDINADGLTDLVSVQTTNSRQFEIQTWLSDGKELIASGSCTMPNIERGGSVTPADVNGDGRVDLLYMITSSTSPLKVYTFLSNYQTLVPADTFVAPKSWPTTNSQVNVLDVNGDARSDIIAYIKPNYAVKSVTVSTFLSVGKTFTADTSQVFPVTDSEEGGKLYTSDLDADNLTDLLWVTSGSGTKQLQIRSFLSQGRYFSSGSLQSFPFFGGSGGTVMTMDVNGDRMGDLVYAGSTFNDTLKLTTFLGNGKDFQSGIQQTGAQAHSTDRCNLVPTDVNGDGMQDLLVVNTGAGAPYLISAYLSKGWGFDAVMNLPQTGGKAQGVPIPVDLDGDAMVDLLYAVLEQGFDDYYYHFSIYEASSKYPCLMSAVDNQIGGLLKISYLPLTDSSVYSRPPLADTAFLPASSQVNTVNGASYGLGTNSVSVGGTSYPIVDVEMPIYAVSGYVKSDNRGDSFGYSMFYSGAKMNRGGYGWLGFESRSVNDSSLNVTGLTYYLQEFPLIGMVDHTSTYRMSDSARLDRVRQTYDITYPVNGDSLIAQPLTVKVAKDMYTYGTWNLTLLMEYAYDTYANPILVSNIGDSTAPNPVYTLTTYSNDTLKWQLGYDLTAKVSRDKAGTTSALYAWGESDYDQYMNVITSREYDNQTGQFVTVKYLYDAYGNDTATVSSSGAVTITRYDREYATYEVQTLSPPNSWGNRLVNSYTYNNAFGLPTSHTDPNGVTNYYAYDGLGRGISVRGPDPEGNITQLLSRSWVLTGDSGYYQESRARLEWNHEEFPWTRIYTDGLIQEYQTTSVGKDFNQIRKTIRTFDSENRMLTESLPFWEGTSPRAFSTTKYDPYGRVIRTKVPKDNNDSIVSVYSFPTRQKTVITEAWGTPDSAQIIILQKFYSSEPQMAVRVNELGDTSYFDYDGLGRPVSYTDALGNSSTVTYNTMGRKQSANTPSMGPTAYYYFDSQLYNLQVNANNDTLLTRFDPLGRETLRRYSPRDSIQYIYDNPACFNGQSELTNVILADGNSYRTTYDDYGNCDSVLFNLAGTTYITVQKYDPNHRLDRMIWPDGSVQKYSYQLDGNMDTLLVDDATDGVLGNYSPYARYEDYNPMGQAAEIRYGNGVTGSFNYFVSGLLDSLQFTGSGGENLLEQVFARDYHNRLTRVQNLDPSSAAWSQQFTYDAAGELIRAVGGYGTYTYGYDKAGNMTSKEGVSWAYSGYQVNYGLVNGDTLSSMRYDRLGNMVNRRLKGRQESFGFDQLQQLTSLRRNDSLVYSFAYDHQGRRILRADSLTNTTVYYVSPTFEVTMGPTDTLYTKYVVGEAGLIASVTAKAAQTKLLQPAVKKGWLDGFHPPKLPWRDWLALICLAGLLVFVGSLIHLRWKRKYWGLRNIHRELIGSLLYGAVLVTAVGLPQTAAAQTPAGEPEPGVLYFHQDYVNSTQLTTDAAGKKSAQVFYDPYGAIASLEGEDNFRPKFNGKQRDDQSDLYYFDSRYYDPLSGRFITADNQLGGSENQSYVFNQYAFTLNNPVNYTDPSGHNVWSWFKHHASQLAAITISTLEIVAGVALTVISDGSLGMVGEGLINAGIEGITYSATHFNNFQWSEFGVAQGIGFATGVAFAGAFRGMSYGAERLTARGAESAAERGVSRVGGETAERGVTRSSDATDCGVNTGCFVKGTLVLTVEGLVPIETVTPGDTVLSYNEETRGIEPREVVQLFRPRTKTIVEITLAGDLIRATEEHPFWVQGKWVEAGDLRRGDTLTSVAGQKIPVLEVVTQPYEGEVYNFEVDETHTYYVAGSEILVHNVCGPKGGKKGAAKTKGISKHKTVKASAAGGGGKSATKIVYINKKPFLECPKGSYLRKVTIKYTGKRGKDFTEANRVVRLKEPGFKKPKNTVWHHYHDFNPKTKEGTMYLLDNSNHKGIFHYGGVSQAKPSFGGHYGLIIELPSYPDQPIYILVYPAKAWRERYRWQALSSAA